MGNIKEGLVLVSAWLLSVIVFVVFGATDIIDAILKRATGRTYFAIDWSREPYNDFY